MRGSQRWEGGEDIVLTRKVEYEEYFCIFQALPLLV